MAATCIEKLPHKCGTRSGLQVFAEDDGRVSGYCFSCNTYVANPYGEERQVSEISRKKKQKTPEEIQEEMELFKSLPSMDILSRKLGKATLEKFGVRVGVSEEDGKTPYIVVFPVHKDGEITGYKARRLQDKLMWQVGDVTSPEFFGEEYALQKGARKVVITEGEFDAMAYEGVYTRHSKDEYQTFYAFVSITHGAGGALKQIQNRQSFLKNFEEVILCFDDDKVGQDAVKKVCTTYPRYRSITLPRKDANDCLMHGQAKAMYNALFKAEKPKNSRILGYDELNESAKAPAKYGDLTWPWPKMQELTKGVFYGHTYYGGSGVKMGKTEFVGDIAVHFMLEHGVPVLIVSPEAMADKDTWKRMVGKAAGRIFHNPDIDFDENAYDIGAAKIGSKLHVLDNWQALEWETLKNDIYFAVQELGVKVVFIDPITNLTAGIDPGETNTMLEKVSQELSIMAKDLNISVFIFCHLKAPDGNISKEVRMKKYREGTHIGLGLCPHEFGGDIYSNQFTGSRAMMRSCNMMFGIEGNKDPELDEETRAIRHIKILEDRSFGATGVVPLFYNKNTGRYVQA